MGSPFLVVKKVFGSYISSTGARQLVCFLRLLHYPGTSYKSLLVRCSPVRLSFSLVPKKDWGMN